MSIVAFSLRLAPYGSGNARLRVLDDELRKKGLTFRQITSVIGYHPRRRELLYEALMHRSFLPLTDGSWISNERLEFLGDAILNTVVADHVFRRFPGSEEGELTRMRVPSSEQADAGAEGPRPPSR